MIEVGKRQTLTMLRSKDFGVYLGVDEKDDEAVLLPRKQVPVDLKIGDSIVVRLQRFISQR